MQTKTSPVRAFQLMVLWLVAHATTVFGLSFNVTLASLTNHNTSAYAVYNQTNNLGSSPHISANFGTTSCINTNGTTIPVDPTKMDESLNPVTPGHVSKTDVHTLIPSRPDLRWFAHSVPWFGPGQSHINNGETNNSTAYVAAMITDMKNRGFNGVIIDWYGQGSYEDSVTLKIQTYLHGLGNNTFKYMIMMDKGMSGGDLSTNNFITQVQYCQSHYFNDTNYELQPTNGGRPILLFFNVEENCPGGAGEMAYVKTQTGGQMVWGEEHTPHLNDSWSDTCFDWMQAYNDGIHASDPFNTNAVKGFYTTMKSNPGKQAIGAMCSSFNGTLTGSVGWSKGKYLPGSNGLCEVEWAATINSAIPTNVTRMQWTTWSDWEEGSQVESGVENNFALTTQLNNTNVLAWTITSGNERTIDHYEVYALTNGGNAALLCSVPNGLHQTNVSQLGLTSGSYQLYVDAVGKPCIRDHLSAPVSYYTYVTGWTNPTSIVYGTALGAGQNNATSSVPGIFVYTPPNGTILPAGTNVLTTVFTPTDTNYLAANLNVTLVVAKAPLTITANAQSKVYGTAQSSPVTGSTAFTPTGLKNGETVGSVTLTYDTGGLLTDSAAGSISTISPSAATGGSFGAANYNITYTAGTLTVTTAPLTITADAQSKSYGTTLTLGAGQTAFTSAGLQNGETVGSVTLTSSGAVNTAPVGSYSIVPSLATGGTFNSANYGITYSSGVLTVFQPQSLPAPWTNQDIGSVGVGGSADYSNGTFMVSGSGADIWGFSDSFQFVYLPWTGDGQIVARVASIQNTAPVAKAGLMFRETLNPGSAQGDLFVSPTSGVSLQGRTVANGITSNVNTTNGITAPCWLMLKRVGNILSGYESPDSVNWTLVGTNVYSMTNSIYVGLCVTSKSNTVLNTSMFDNVTVDGTWLNQDIGSVGLQGSSLINYSNGAVTVSGSGFDVWWTDDQFQYLYQANSGDCAIIARVTGIQGTAPWAKAGVMFRETVATNSRNTILFLSPSNGVSFQGRTTTGGLTVTAGGVTNLVAPQWIQLVRSSQNMNAYMSTNGVNWSWIGTQTNPMSTSSYDIGLVVCSRSNTVLNTSTFDNVSVQSAWTSGDIGPVGVLGGATIDDSTGTFTVSGSGPDIWSSNDAFQFVDQPLYGNGQIVARVVSVQNTAPWAKAGVMVRDTESANSINALLFVSPTNGVSFQGRSITGGSSSTFQTTTGIGTPRWLKLIRSGSSLSAYQSSNGSSWTAVGTTQTITMSTNAWIGLAVGSRTNSVLNTSTFDNVTVTPTP
ncbi:MAG TPA: MBG domain-containing protein [Verrucomicrobiae bacterium]|nr:MBG domain-containing protein [Verrucomicrobiae bacterium]